MQDPPKDPVLFLEYKYAILEASGYAKTYLNAKQASAKKNHSSFKASLFIDEFLAYLQECFIEIEGGDAEGRKWSHFSKAISLSRFKSENASKPFIITREFFKTLQNTRPESMAEEVHRLITFLEKGETNVIFEGPFTYSSYGYDVNRRYLYQVDTLYRINQLHSPPNDKYNYRYSYQWKRIPLRLIGYANNRDSALRNAIKKDSKFLYQSSIEQANNAYTLMKNVLQSRLEIVHSDKELIKQVLNAQLRVKYHSLPGLIDSRLRAEIQVNNNNGKEEKIENPKLQKYLSVAIPLYFDVLGEYVKALPDHFVMEKQFIIFPAPETFSIYNMISMQNGYLHHNLDDYTNLITEKLSLLEEKFNNSLISNGRSSSVLSPQEQQILKIPDNILLLGRSGTGKTTCALLRLYAQNCLASTLTLRDDEELENEENALGQQDDFSHGTQIDKRLFEAPTHSLFISLSPVLCTHAKKYYRKFMQNESTEKSSHPLMNVLVEEEEEDPVAIEEEEEDLLNLPNSLSELKEGDSPTFLTFKRFLYMLDATLDQPFFARDEEKNIIGSENNSATWHDEGGGMMKIASRQYAEIDETADDIIGDDIEDDFDKPKELKKVQQAEVKVVEKSMSSFEIDYALFEKQYPQQNGIHPSLVWTEIQSYIKGSIEALNSPNGFISYDDYLKMGRSRSVISQSQRETIYSIFCLYQNTKRGYDLQDLVYYIYTHIKHEGYHGKLMRNVFIDEVQDFTQASIQLIMEVCPYQTGYFLTGDTCQTIARGVGFRFSELKSLFYYRKERSHIFKEYYDVPTVQQLTYNFRSHRQIINLGNSIVKLLECKFPTSIDILATDQGQTDGPVPVAMVYNNDEELFQFLFGHSKDSENVNMQFGAQQVVIVRDKESKEKLPELLQHALCMTVYEAKGLEFEDVILYNFFTDSPAHEEWKTINAIAPYQALLNPDVNAGSGVESLQLFSENDESEFQKIVDEIGNKGFASKVMFSAVKHSLLCSELKHLYTAVTRAKRNLFLFDSNVEKLFPMLRYWKQSELIHVRQLSESDQVGIAAQTTPDEWKKQGLVMLKHSYFAQAMHCFKNSGDKHLYRRAEAFQMANEASLLLKQYQHPSVFDYNDYDDAKMKLPNPWENPSKELNAIEDKAFTLYLNAATIFEELGCKKYAARCFASRQDHLKAAELFLQAECFKEAALNYVDQNEYQLAARCYHRLHDIEHAIAFYELADCYSDIIDLIYTENLQHDMNLLKSYFSQAINSFLQHGKDMDFIIEYVHSHLIPVLHEDGSYHLPDPFLPTPPEQRWTLRKLVDDPEVEKQLISVCNMYELTDFSARVMAEMSYHYPSDKLTENVRSLAFQSIVSLAASYRSTPKAKREKRKAILEQIGSSLRLLAPTPENLYFVVQLLEGLSLWRTCGKYLLSMKSPLSVTLFVAHNAYSLAFDAYQTLIAATPVASPEILTMKLNSLNMIVKDYFYSSYKWPNTFTRPTDELITHLSNSFSNHTDILQSQLLHYQPINNPKAVAADPAATIIINTTKEYTAEHDLFNVIELLRTFKSDDVVEIFNTSQNFSWYSHYRLLGMLYCESKGNKQISFHIVELMFHYVKSIVFLLNRNRFLDQSHHIIDRNDLLGANECAFLYDAKHRSHWKLVKEAMKLFFIELNDGDDHYGDDMSVIAFTIFNTFTTKQQEEEGRLGDRLHNIAVKLVTAINSRLKSLRKGKTYSNVDFVRLIEQFYHYVGYFGLYSVDINNKVHSTTTQLLHKLLPTSPLFPALLSSPPLLSSPLRQYKTLIYNSVMGFFIRHWKNDQSSNPFYSCMKMGDHELLIWEEILGMIAKNPSHTKCRHLAYLELVSFPRIIQTDLLRACRIMSQRIAEHTFYAMFMTPLIIKAITTYAILNRKTAYLPKQYLPYAERFQSTPPNSDDVLRALFDIFEALVYKLKDHHDKEIIPDDENVNRDIADEVFLEILLISMSTPIPDAEYDDELIQIIVSYVESLDFDITALDYCHLLSGEQQTHHRGDKLVEALNDDYAYQIQDGWEALQMTSFPERNSNVEVEFEDELKKLRRLIASKIITRQAAKKSAALRKFSQIGYHTRFTLYQLSHLPSTFPLRARELLPFVEKLLLLHDRQRNMFDLIRKQDVSSEDALKLYAPLSNACQCIFQVSELLQKKTPVSPSDIDELLKKITSFLVNPAHDYQPQENQAVSRDITIEEKREVERKKAILKRKNKKKQALLLRKKQWIKNRF